MGILTMVAGLGFSGFLESLGPILWSSFLKLFLLPNLARIRCWWFDLEREPMIIVLVFCSFPASESAYVMAHQMGGDAELMASILAVQTLISIFLLSGILLVMEPA